MTADYFTDRAHMLISGVSGSRTDYGGKTALANWWLDQWGHCFDLALFLNFKRDDNVRGERVATLDELADAIAAGKSHINYVPENPDWQEEHERLQEFIRALPDDMSKIIVHDEAPEYDDESLLYFVRVAGNGNNCKSLVVAQSPTDLSTSVRNQCVPVWVGPTTEQNKHYFKANSYSNHYEFIQQVHDPYFWTVITGPGDDDRDHYQPVPEDYAA